jgi:dihydroorotate dehydrogenase electron transfer subunit
MFNEICKILINKEIAAGIYEMELFSPCIAQAAQPGQFVHIRIHEGLYPLMRRPVSIHTTDQQRSTVTLLYRVAGQGTAELSKKEKGGSLDMMGPLGKGFPVMKHKKCAVVGGGIGMAPLLELAKSLEHCDAYLGFRDAAYKVEAFEEACGGVFMATEDGSAGYGGFVTELLKENIKSYDVIYSCGPKPMLKKVMEICQSSGVRCFVSLEERMGCGIGACLVCACKIKGEDGGWHHKKACKDGPVFDAREVEFDA